MKEFYIFKHKIMLLYTLVLWRHIQVPGRVFPPNAMAITLALQK